MNPQLPPLMEVMKTELWCVGKLEIENGLNKMVMIAVVSNQSSFPINASRGFT